MFGIAQCRPVVASILTAGCALVGSTALAHPVFDPFDNTQFAPITRFGPLITLEPVVTGLVSPLKGVAAPGDSSHLYIVDQPGQIWKVNLNSPSLPVSVAGMTPFLDVRARMNASGNTMVTLGALGPNTFDERGLLGLAFHPAFQKNGKFYTYVSVNNRGPATLPSTIPAASTADHQNVVVEWILQSGTITGPRILLRVDWPQFNHDGGDLAFGADGMLYISMGDGGGADDRDGQDFLGAPIIGHGNCGNGQNLTNPLGKILRIDVNGNNSANGQYGIPTSNPFVGLAGAVKEIFAYGLRNPYRMSFDRRTGKLYVGDVGQNDLEEVNVIVRGGNFGWNVKEGTLFFNTNGTADGFAEEHPSPEGCPQATNLIDPIAQYDNHHEGHSVIAGFVYRGKRLHDLNGNFIFGDYSRLFNLPSGPHNYGRLFHINPSGGSKRLHTIREFHITPSNAPNIAVLGFGEDAAGEVYVTGNVLGIPFDTGGVVMRLAPAPHHDHDHDD